MRNPWSKLVLLLLAPMALASVASGATAIQAQGGIGLVAVTSSVSGALLVLSDHRGHEVARGTTDRFGSLIFRELDPGRGYVVRDDASGDTVPVTVLAFKDHPDQSFYAQQTLHEGLNYIRTRDGTLLAAMVRPPLGGSLASGQFPTVVEYSGYAAADPDNPQPSTLIASALGYATVGVNMRGSGCSGGVFDLFDLPTTADGYDIIETVAAQPWVQNGKVGMIGISFPGITQLFVGGAQPPHLAAIAPLSVIADIYRSPGFPGGIFNNGFAETWLQERADDAQPAPEGGQSWAIKRVNNGDTTCLANQRLRLQTQDPVEVTRDHPFYTPSLMDNRSPINWVDEHPGADLPRRRVAGRADRRRLRLDAVDGSRSGPTSRSRCRTACTPARSIPTCSTTGSRFSTSTSRIRCRIRDASLRSRRSSIPRSSARARRRRRCPRIASTASPTTARRSTLFESDPHVRVLMENGAGSSIPGLPAPTFELGFSKWPPREIRPTAWYFGPDGTLTSRQAAGRTATSTAIAPIPTRVPRQTLPGDGSAESWALLPAVRLATLRRRHGRGLRDRAARRRRDHRRAGQRRSLAALERPRHGHPGDAHRDPPRRLRDLRAERLAAREPCASSSTKRSTRLEPRPTYLEQRCAPAARGQVHQGARRSLRGGARRSAPARASGSASRPRAATARAGRSTRRRPTATVAERRLADAVATVPARAAGRARRRRRRRRCRRARAFAASRAGRTCRRRTAASRAAAQSVISTFFPSFFAR